MNQEELNKNLIAACHIGDINKVKYLNENGANINCNGNYPVFLAWRNGYLEILKYLVNAGGSIYSNDYNVMFWARLKNRLDILNYLIDTDAGAKWKCYDCLKRFTCKSICEEWER